MGLIENYCKFKTGSLLVSKTTINSHLSYPKFKSFIFYFFLNLKHYKKNLLLFYLVISLIIGVVVFKKKKIGSYLVLKLVIKKNKIYLFTQAFINFYLPLSDKEQSVYRYATIKRQASGNVCSYRINYFNFPPIFELESIYSEFSLVYDFVSNFKFQLDVLIKNFQLGDVLLRMYRFPCRVKLSS
jgi:hypothetical protein